METIESLGQDQPNSGAHTKTAISDAINFLELTILVVVCFFAVISVSCAPDDGVSKSQSDFWQERVIWAKNQLQRSDLTNEERGSLKVRLALAYSGLGDDEQAFENLELVLADSKGDPVSKGMALYWSAYFNEERNEWQKAIDGYKKFAEFLASLPTELRYKFNGTNQDPASLLFHVGEIQEHYLNRADDGEESYVIAIAYARRTSSLSLVDLTEHLGDFYFRQRRYQDALDQYEGIAWVGYSNDGQLRPVVILSSNYKLIKCLSLLGRCEDARTKLATIEPEWGESADELNRGYVEKAREFLDAHCEK